MESTASKYFEGIVTAPDENINLAEAALHIAFHACPDVNIPACIGRLDLMAGELRAKMPPRGPAAGLIGAMNDYLFREQGFTGNWKNFNDPRNSFLNEVLDRKLGIPISLSILYMEIARRVGVCIHGVSFPGHFLVRLEDTREALIIDPFSGGLILQPRDLKERIEQFDQGRLGNRDLAELLRPATSREILVRALRNLRYIYMETGEFDHALHVTNLQLLIDPASPDGLRDRGEIFSRLDCYRAARDDLARYLELNPQAVDFADVSTRLAELQQSINRLH